MNKLFLRIVLLFFVLPLSFILKAQTIDSTVTIIFTGTPQQKKAKKEKEPTWENIIKVAPTGMFVGSIPIIYERRLSESIGIQASLGVTSRNFMRGLFKYTSLDNYNWPTNTSYSYSDVIDDIYTFNLRQSEIGTTFSIEPKFYFDAEALRGIYVGFSYNYYSYKFSTPKAVLNTAKDRIEFISERKNESEKITDFMVHVGRQNIHKHLAFELALAAGLRKVEGTKYIASYKGAGSFYDGFGTYKQLIPHIELTIRLGYAF